MSAIFDPPYPIPYNPINGTVEAFEGTIRPVYNVLDYGADPTGVNPSAGPVQQALNDAARAGGAQVIAPGRLLIESPLTVTGSGVFLMGTALAWEYGNGFAYTGSMLIADSTFPVGERIIQWNDYGPSTPAGGGISNLAIDCGGIADGVYALNTYRFTAKYLQIHAPWSSGIVSVVPQASGSVDSNTFQKVKVFGPLCNPVTINGYAITPAGLVLGQGIYHSVMRDCYVINSAADGYVVGGAAYAYSCNVVDCMADTSAHNQYRFLSSQYGALIGSKTFGVPGHTCLLLEGGGDNQILGNFFSGSNSGNNYPSRAAVILNAAPGSLVVGNIIQGVGYSDYGIQDTQSSGTASYYEANSLSGSFATAPVSIVSPSPSIARNNSGYNPVGPVTVAVPASGTATAALPYDATFYITQATAASSVAVQGQTIAIPIGGPTAIRVPAGQTLTPTYTTAPTWVVMGD